MPRLPVARPPLVAADPDARVRRFGWLLWLAALPMLAIVGLLVETDQLPLLAPLAGLWLLWPIWRGGRLLWQMLVDSPHAQWQGSYREFDGQPIRVLEDDDHRLWVCAADVFDALDLPQPMRDPARVRLAAGREGLRRPPGSRVICFTERGLDAWLEGRSDRRIAGFQHWWRTQVMEPHRRRLARDGYASGIL
jgi:hypothetical protein